MDRSMHTAVTLPGGMWRADRRVRDATFRPLTGHLEQQFAVLAGQPGTAARVSGVLAAALATLGGVAVTPSMTAALCVTDRQFLMVALACQLGSDQQWRHLACARCEARFDIGFKLSELPLSPAGSTYPWTEIEVSGQQLRLRVPTGEDEAAITGLDAEAARNAVAERCVVAVDNESRAMPASLQLDAAAVDAIDAALDAVTPQLGTTLSTACRECALPQRFEIDPYRLALPDAEELYREIHALALRYHWSESQCLRLPRERRRRYLALIEQSLGMTSEVA
jgi:hypothetical protein